MAGDEIGEAHRLLRTGGWLAAAPADFQAAVLDNCLWRREPGGVALTHGGDTEGGLVGVANGAVNITSAMGPSDSPVAHIARAPFWFGELPAVAHGARTITVVTRTACDVAVLPQHAINAMMAARPEWWRLLGALSAEGLALLCQIATDLLIGDSHRRCVAVLLRVAERRKSGDAPCDADISQGELAAMANMSRQTTGLALRTLEAQGALELGYRSITILDPTALRAIVNV